MKSTLLPRWLARLFAFLYYGQLVGYVLNAGVLIYLYAFGFPEGGKWTITANIKGIVSAPKSMSETNKNLQEWTKTTFELTHHSNNWLSLSRADNSMYLSLKGPVDLSKLPMSLLLAGSSGLLLALLGIFTSYMFMKLFQSLAEKHVFDEKQINRLTRIGQGFLVFALFSVGTKLLAEKGALSYLESYGFIINELSEQNYNLTVSAPSSEVIIALTGLCILALSQVFKYGMQLQQDNELTI